MFFSKPEEQQTQLALTYVEDPGDLEAGVLSFEASGEILGEPKYCYASYMLKHRRMYDSGEFDRMVELLRNSPKRAVIVRLKVKRGRATDFRIDLDSLAQAYREERFKSLELIGWGLNEKSFAQPGGQQDNP